jgi:hypothetical protein
VEDTFVPAKAYQYANGSYMPITAVPKKVTIKNTNFTQNYAGQRGSSLNLQNIQTSTVQLENLRVLNNTGSYSIFEAEHSLPFYDVLTLTKYKLNWISHAGASRTECADEISYIGTTTCSVNEQYNTNAVSAQEAANPLQGHVVHQQHPAMRGTIFLTEISNVNLTSSYFTLNDAGPTLVRHQVVGLVDNSGSFYNIRKASILFVGSNSHNISIS